MRKGEKDTTSVQAASAEDEAAIQHMRQEITAGKHWYLALLGAMGRWTSVEETHDARTFCYLIAGEAFDWQMLAERLCLAVDDLLPEAEKNALLFQGRPPISLTQETVKGLIGASKYHQYLNYFYGVTVEGALLLAVQEEVFKERWIRGHDSEDRVTEEAYRRIYGAEREALLLGFRQAGGRPRRQSITLTELKEFTYWLFKYRLSHGEKARVASDTRKALDYLQRQWASHGSFGVLASGDAAPAENPD